MRQFGVNKGIIMMRKKNICAIGLLILGMMNVGFSYAMDKGSDEKKSETERLLARAREREARCAAHPISEDAFDYGPPVITCGLVLRDVRNLLCEKISARPWFFAGIAAATIGGTILVARKGFRGAGLFVKNSVANTSSRLWKRIRGLKSARA